MKRSSINRSSKTPLAKAKSKLWQTLKAVIDIRDGNKCISCGAVNIIGANKHGGHFIPSSSCGGFLRYDLRNVFNQCATCNLFRNGAGAEYTLELQKRFGGEFVEKIIRDKQKVIKLDIEYVTELTKYYESLLGQTQKQLISLTKNYNGFKIS